MAHAQEPAVADEVAELVSLDVLALVFINPLATRTVASASTCVRAETVRAY